MNAFLQRRSKAELESLALRQWDDYQRRAPGTYFGEPENSLTLEEAYAVQRFTAGIRCALGDAIIGYKIGCIGATVVEQFGMSGPIHARLFRSEVRNSGEVLEYESYANLAIEGEMAIRIGASGRIEAAFPVIELHHFIFRGRGKTLSELVANNGLNAGIVVPDRKTTFQLESLTSASTLSVVINGEVIETGTLWAMEGDAKAAVDWLQSDLGRYGIRLSPGDIVLAGTPLGLNRLRPGDHVIVAVDGYNCVECFIA